MRPLTLSLISLLCRRHRTSHRILAGVRATDALSGAKRGKSDAGEGNRYAYPAIRDLEVRVPDKFNFAQDVIDDFAAREDTRDSPALFHVSGGKEERETRWSYSELSSLSRRAATALNNVCGGGGGGGGRLKRAVTVLPKVPEWWLLNAAALRTGTVLLPGTTLLSSSDLGARLQVKTMNEFVALVFT